MKQILPLLLLCALLLPAAAQTNEDEPVVALATITGTLIEGDGKFASGNEVFISGLAPVVPFVASADGELFTGFYDSRNLWAAVGEAGQVTGTLTVAADVVASDEDILVIPVTITASYDDGGTPDDRSDDVLDYYSAEEGFVILTLAYTEAFTDSGAVFGGSDLGVDAFSRFTLTLNITGPLEELINAERVTTSRPCSPRTACTRRGRRP
mgnify:CR=1 FL=1|jgi:hypothetical protein